MDKRKSLGYLIDQRVPSFSEIIWIRQLVSRQMFNDFRFEFLNISHSFQNVNIDWNYSKEGKLWTYNLNYFDFLNQKNLTYTKGSSLMKDYVEFENQLLDGKEPYPISLRMINWVKFLTVNNSKEKSLVKHIWKSYQLLKVQLEYHLLGNHILENGFSMLFGAYYFQDKEYCEIAEIILKEELAEQILDDGGHFELSPMYHQILLERLLDCIQLITLNKGIFDHKDLLSFLREKALRMCNWLNTITFSNGDIPMVNDSAFDIAHSSKELLEYAQKMNIRFDKSNLSDSGYRVIRKTVNGKKIELFIDVGQIGPDYIPGHAHADTFNFLMYIGGRPIIVDRGTSTYEKNQLRQSERSTSSHNTLRIEDMNSSNVWGGFRVAERARVKVTKDLDEIIVAEHNGYSKLGVKHQRVFDFGKDNLEIKDLLFGKKLAKDIFLDLHFETGLSFRIQDNRVVLPVVTIEFVGARSIEAQKYPLAKGFNKHIEASKVVVCANNEISMNFIFR